MIFRESSKGTVKSINITKSSIEESTVYQYISLPVSGNYTVTVHDIVDGTIITNPSVVYPQVLEYIFLLPSPPTEMITATCKYSTHCIVLLFDNILGTVITLNTMIMTVHDVITIFSTIASIGPTSGVFNCKINL